MSEYKAKDPNYCKICGERLTPGEAVEWVKHKGTTYYVHADCLKKEAER